MRLIVICVLLWATTADASDIFGGPIALEPGSFHDDQPPQIDHSGDIAYTVKIFVDDFAGTEAIYAYTQVRNTTDTARKLAFHVAYFDADGQLVATARHVTTLKPGAETQLGGLYSEVAAGQWQSVASYQYVVTGLP